MKSNYEMTDDEFSEIMEISRQPVMYLSGGTPMYDTLNDANRFWQKLADKYGFVWDSVEPGAMPKQFVATKTKQTL